MPRKIHLVVIDPQNSFCKVVDPTQQQTIHDGELCVKGAWDDMNRLADFVKKFKKTLYKISVTLDSHQQMHVAHPIWYKDSNGKNPDPFTLMREENGEIIGSKVDANGSLYDVGKYICFSPYATDKTLTYLKELKLKNRYAHCIWPMHCLIGTPGHNVVPQLMEQLLEWERTNYEAVEYVTKGSNFFVEHFSAVQAEVPDSTDPMTQMNTTFIKQIMEADEILFSGEAGSHCLANTVRDIASYFKDDSFVSKCILLTDATSPVPGFEHLQKDFINDMVKLGMRTSTCQDYLS
jgi:nicotinamidase-related amidase